MVRVSALRKPLRWKFREGNHFGIPQFGNFAEEHKKIRIVVRVIVWKGS